MSSISGMGNNMMSAIFAQGMQSRPDPAQKFNELDTDGNGGLDKVELSAMAKELAAKTGKTLDVDESISIYDSNSDGLLDQDEMDTMMHEVLGPPPGRGAGGNSGVAAEDNLALLLQMLDQSEDASSSAISRPDPEQKFKELDSDGSGGLSKSELDVMAADFSAMTGQNIDTDESISTYDANGDGELDKDEMDTMMEALQEKAGGPPQFQSMSGMMCLRQQVEAYQTNSGADDLSLLPQLLSQLAGNSQTAAIRLQSSYV